MGRTLLLVPRREGRRPQPPPPLLSISDLQTRIRRIEDVGLRAVMRATLKASVAADPASLQELGQDFEKILLSIKDVCKRLGMGETAVRKLINAGPKKGLLSIHFGRSVFIPVRAVDAMVARTIREQHGLNIEDL